MTARDAVGTGGGLARGSGPRGRRAWRAGRRPSADGAAVLAILLPGLGHLYAGRRRAAALWLVAILAGYWAVSWPGFVLHGLSIVSAWRAAAGRNGGRKSPGRPANP